MKKKVWKNHPEYGSRGHYVYLDDESIGTWPGDNDGLPLRYEKFADKDLYTVVKEDQLNTYIVDHQLTFIGLSSVKIDDFIISNNGVDHDITNTYAKAYIFDDQVWEDTSEQTTNPQNLTYDELEVIMQFTHGSEGTFDKHMFYNHNLPSFKENKSPGQVIGNTVIFEELADTRLAEYEHHNPNFIPSESFDPEFPANDPSNGLGDGYPSIFTNIRGTQMVYIIVWMQGDANAWYDSNDIRKKSCQIFRFDAGELFDDVGGLVSTIPFEYGDSTFREGYGNREGGSIAAAEKAAFKVTSLKLTINTELAWPEVTPVPAIVEPFKSMVQPPMGMHFNTFDETFLNQRPNQSIYNLVSDVYTEGIESSVMNNFEPVAITKIEGLPRSTDGVWDLAPYDLQVYYDEPINRQINSSPTSVNLDFYISNFSEEASYWLNGHPDYIGPSLQESNNLEYKFYVLDWDDIDDKFNSVEDFIVDMPSNIYGLYKKRENNLYNFSPIGVSLSHTYSTPGIKTIKSILFSHTIEEDEGKIQVVRWKFIKTRIFLDIPVHQYPDFNELGGTDYKTLPWPSTTGIIGGTDESSNYRISINEILTGGKIGDTDIIDERFLVEALENNETGKSILEFDLEQVRYFTTGSYDMNNLLEIDLHTTQPDISPEYLETLPFPEWFEEFDITNDNDIDVDDIIVWNHYGRPDISQYIQDNIHNLQPPAGGGQDTNIFYNIISFSRLYSNSDYWDCSDWNSERTYCFPEESSVGQIFINEHLDQNLKKDCEFEFNCGDIDRKSILDSAGNGNSGMIIGDYKIKKIRKGKSMRRDSYIKIPKKSNINGAM